MEECYATDPRGYHFNRSVVIALEAVVRFAHRYADLAEELARKEGDQTRKQELLAIAENCRTVPEFPAKSFWQATQATARWAPSSGYFVFWWSSRVKRTGTHPCTEWQRSQAASGVPLFPIWPRWASVWQSAQAPKASGLKTAFFSPGKGPWQALHATGACWPRSG